MRGTHFLHRRLEFGGRFRRRLHAEGLEERRLLAGGDVLGPFSASLAVETATPALVGSAWSEPQVSLAPKSSGIALASASGATTANEIIVSTDTEFLQAVAVAGPGTTISIAPGTYDRWYIPQSGLRGTAEAPITIQGLDPSSPPVIVAQLNGVLRKEAIHLGDMSYVILRNLVAQGGSENGVNIDSSSQELQSNGLKNTHHVTIENLTILDTDTDGNHDALKISDVDFFTVRNSRMEQWGGSAIDCLRCRYGVVEGNQFLGTNTGNNAVNMKYQTENMLILRNFIRDASTDQAINIGGPEIPGPGGYAARDIEVAGNRFVGSGAPVAWNSSDGGFVHHNTVVLPRKWLMRISGRLEFEGGRFENNLIVFDSDVVKQEGWRVNMHSLTPADAPQSFSFAQNAWFDQSQKPFDINVDLPTAEINGVYGVDPELDSLVDPALSAQSMSPLLANIGADNFSAESVTQLPPIDAGPDQQHVLANVPTPITGQIHGASELSLLVRTVWRQTSGPGSVSFEGRDELSAYASFSEPGSYTLELTSYYGSLTRSDTISVNVTNLPVANADGFAVPQDSGATRLDVLANDESGGGPALMISDVGTPSNGGTAVIVDNQIQYTPLPGFVGQETFTYDVDNGLSGGDDSATVTVSVLPASTPQVAAVRIRLTDTDFLNLAEVEILQRSTGINLALTGTATQSSIYNGNTGAEKAIDGDTVSGYPVSLTHTRREFGAWWQLELLQPADVETIRVYNRDGYGTRLEDAVVEALAADGSILWSDVITGADNGSIHSFNVAIGVGSSSPTPFDDDFTVSQDGGASLLDVLANDESGGGPALMISDVGTPSNGGTAVIVDNQIQYTPLPGFVGQETFTYDVDNGLSGGDDSAAVTVSVLPASTPQVAAVRIRLTDTDFLNLAEVEILQRSTGINLALTGTATQSSIYNGNTGAEKAIDGDTVSGYPVSLTHTRREFGAWWQLELLQPADVETIRVYNRDGYGTRLEDAVVEALAADGSILWSDVITGADNGSIHSFDLL